MFIISVPSDNVRSSPLVASKNIVGKCGVGNRFAYFDVKPGGWYEIWYNNHKAYTHISNGFVENKTDKNYRISDLNK